MDDDVGAMGGGKKVRRGGVMFMDIDQAANKEGTGKKGSLMF